ncbi:ComEA family DNA-binding protein [Streptomyces sp. SCA3-4]|uniref:ComEA family DNA-binding protein n=1 Tax=Streptomyces sichuanensis TaxID=2871810 RepID=UPI001CE25798|nr:ComEA family DNA-binding protein [Streptomyces sichuanensis]MCA6091449.1 ComEA family DNA-binding protein [Streptomyces sichuanensis]
MTPRSHAVHVAGSPSLAEDFGSLRAGTSPPPEPNATPAYVRWWHAMRERMPLWVQLRCGIEPKTLAALALVLVAAVVLAGYHFWAGRPQTVRAPVREGPAAMAPAADRSAAARAAPPPGTGEGPAPAPDATAAASAGVRGVVVDVAGKVLHPGIQQLPPGSRVADALAAAGGVRPGVDTAGLNRARVLSDGEQILVGVAGSGGPGATVGGPGAPGGNGSPGGNGGAGRDSGPGAAGAGKAPGGPVSLNSATLEQLDALPGVGPVLAQHILDYRTRHGGFRSVADLRKVNGIGARRFTDLKPLVQP